jgi:hypothetical protein
MDLPPLPKKKIDSAAGGVAGARARASAMDVNGVGT